jgi:hypothetical protein
MPCVNDDIHLEHELTEYALGQAHPFVHTWLGDRLRKDLRKSTSSMIALITDVEAARTFSEAMSVLGLPPDPFRARLLEIDGYRFLAQIHFPDRSGKLPYVEVYRASTPLGAIDDQIIVRKLRDRFDIFRPQRVRFFQSTHIPMLAPATRVDQHFLVAPARDMATRPEPPGFGRVVLRRPRNLDFYPRYVEAYEQMFTARPQLRGQVRIEPEKSLANCLEQELLFEIYVDDAWAGIVAASTETFAGVTGCYMNEIVLEGAARGQGLGPAVHQHFAKVVAAENPSGVITGMIASVNVPSLKTAMRAGRIEVGAWHWWYSPPDGPT